TVFARSKEIQIKKYIGASNPMITSPFIIEGIVFGLIGSALAFVIVYLLYNYLFENYSRAVFNLISSYLIDPAMIMTNILIILITLGVGIGALGSIFSVRKHLEV
ncbi:MAG: FtsX-like permease family protein, partial [Gallicola sp.]|nr:FtsX-like permease family protein [Gallicola sp.]